jgi:hypothetical protein
VTAAGVTAAGVTAADARPGALHSHPA